MNYMKKHCNYWSMELQYSPFVVNLSTLVEDKRFQPEKV